ncbi:hypothetical protein EVB56_074 [Rhizobium phage RHph_Y1_10]|nr:hypothetical protein EVB56_074 [Rhizobium phage RHph_Y1_10]
MATGTAATTARQLATQQTHYLRCGITYADNGVAKIVGIIPANSQIINLTSGVYIREAFNAGTTNVLDIGTSADDDLYATDLALGAKAFVAIDEAATATNVNGWYVTVDTTITATVALSGTAATTGQAEVIISYIPDNDK